MRDVTAEVEIRYKERVPGKNYRDELFFKDVKIGVLEPQGQVLTDPHFVLRFKPGRHPGSQEPRIFLLTDHELEASQTGSAV
jgi:hypothetical protein